MQNIGFCSGGWKFSFLFFPESPVSLAHGLMMLLFFHSSRVCVCVGIEIDFGTSKDERERDMNEVPEHRVQFRVETVAQKATPSKAKFDESLPVEMIFSTGSGKESLVDRFVVGGGRWG